jgi:restriction system protein
MLPKHKYLLTYRYSEIIFDLTDDFCLRYLRNLGYLRGIPTRRTIEQMTQAARSDKQNIVEAIGQSATSKKGEIKLLGVAKASLEELIADYEDYLRVNNLKIWIKTDKKITDFRQTAFRLTALSNLSDLGNLKEKAVLPRNAEEAANFLLTLCHQASFLLHKQIQKAEETFINEGGYSENLLKKRLEAKIK